MRVDKLINRLINLEDQGTSEEWGEVVFVIGDRTYAFDSVKLNDRNVATVRLTAKLSKAEYLAAYGNADGRKGNLKAVKGGRVHRRGIQLAASHVIPDCEVGANKGWRLYARDAKAVTAGDAFYGTTDPVTCPACRK